MTVKELPARADVPAETTWDATRTFATYEAWEATLDGLKDRIGAVVAYKGRLAEGPDILADCLKLQEDLMRDAMRGYVYANLFYSVDTTDQRASAMNDRARAAFGMVMAGTAFIRPEMLQIGVDTLRQWATEQPRLQVYQHAFDMLAQDAPHVRSAEVEEVLGQMADMLGTAMATHGVLGNSELKYAPAIASDGSQVEFNNGTYADLLNSPDRDLRRTTYEHFADAHLGFKNTMANALAAGIKRDVFNARVRGYANSLEAALKPNYIPTEVFHNTIDTYKKHLPTWHRYWRARRRALGVDTLYAYDVKAPMTHANPAVPYATAVDWIAQGLQPLGEDYVNALRQGATTDRWVDVYPNKGKRAGAFSMGGVGTPPYIFMSYSDNLFSMSTLAHELGHSMHTYFTLQNQPLIYARYTLFVAEVASNFNQALTRAWLFDNYDDVEFQIAVIEEAMANFHRYFFIMPTLARFELEIHERVERGQPLTADSLNSLLADLFAEGYGDEVVFDREREGITWAEFHTHMYSNFYVYQYTTGISGAHALAKKVLAGEPHAAENYLQFLKAGNSLYPLDALKLAGVDMTGPEPVEETFAVLAGLVDRLEGLLDRRAAKMN